LDINKNPGSGAYNLNSKWNNNKGKFLESRNIMRVNQNPGPGHYDIKATIPDVAKYSLPNQG